jgi:hypothetical protein
MMDFENKKFRKIFFEIYEHLPRGGPGDAASTRKAYALTKGLPGHPKILDVGCGPGRQTMDLARISPLAMIDKCGYVLMGNFTLPKSSWRDDFYTPMAARIAEVKKRYQHDQEVMEMMPYFQNEIEIYNKYSDYFSYEFFVMRK